MSVIDEVYQVTLTIACQEIELFSTTLDIFLLVRQSFDWMAKILVPVCEISHLSHPGN